MAKMNTQTIYWDETKGLQQLRLDEGGEGGEAGQKPLGEGAFVRHVVVSLRAQSDSVSPGGLLAFFNEKRKLASEHSAWFGLLSGLVSGVQEVAGTAATL